MTGSDAGKMMYVTDRCDALTFMQEAWTGDGVEHGESLRTREPLFVIEVRSKLVKVLTRFGVRYLRHSLVSD